MLRTHKIFARFLLGALLMVGVPVSAAEMPVALTCSLGGNTAKLTKGTNTTFDCSVKNNGSKSYSAMLLGKQTSDTGTPAASSTTLDLAPNGSSKASLNFPAVYQPGSYRYTFSLIDLDTKTAISNEYEAKATLGGNAAARIGNLSVDKAAYAWGEPLVLNLSVTLPEGQSLANMPVYYNAVVPDAQGEKCATLVTKQALDNVNGTYALTLPQGDVTNTCINSIVVKLLDTDGAVLDQKTLAFGLAGTSGAATTDQGVLSQGGKLLSSPIFWGIVLTLVLVLVIWFVKRNRNRPTMMQG